MIEQPNEFPTTNLHREENEVEMTLRDYFAAKLIPAMYRDYWEDVRAGRTFPTGDDWKMALAIDAYSIADSMLKAKEYNNENPQQN